MLPDKRFKMVSLNSFMCCLSIKLLMFLQSPSIFLLLILVYPSSTCIIFMFTLREDDREITYLFFCYCSVRSVTFFYFSILLVYIHCTFRCCNTLCILLYSIIMRSFLLSIITNTVNL